MKKSELPITFELSTQTPPPLAPSSAWKWLGLGISIPSTLHKRPRGEFPRTTISLSSFDVDATPAYDCAILDGSVIPPA